VIRFLHIADTHTGTELYGRTNPVTGLNTRLEDFVRALSHIVDVALERKVDAVLFAGDAYPGPTPSQTHQRAFVREIRRFIAANIPVLMIPGNHDMTAAEGKATALDVFADLADVTVVRDPKLTVVVTSSGILQVACLPWLHRSRLMADQDLSAEEAVRRLEQMGADLIARMASEVDPNHPAVLLAHLAAEEATYSGTERTASIGRDPVFKTNDLANPTFQYVALGHVHYHQDLNAEGPPVVYPGSIERLNFGEKDGNPGAVIVEIDYDLNRQVYEADYTHIPSPARTMVTISTVSQSDPTEGILQQIGEQDITEAIVRVIYDAPQPPDATAVRKALDAAGAHYVAGIKAAPHKRKIARREGISQGATTQQALKAWLKTQPDLMQSNDMPAAILSAAADLEAELEEATT